MYKRDVGVPSIFFFKTGAGALQKASFDRAKLELLDRSNHNQGLGHTKKKKMSEGRGYIKSTSYTPIGRQGRGTRDKDATPEFPLTLPPPEGASNVKTSLMAATSDLPIARTSGCSSWRPPTTSLSLKWK